MICSYESWTHLYTFTFVILTIEKDDKCFSYFETVVDCKKRSETFNFIFEFRKLNNLQKSWCLTRTMLSEVMYLSMFSWNLSLTCLMPSYRSVSVSYLCPILVLCPNSGQYRLLVSWSHTDHYQFHALCHLTSQYQLFVWCPHTNHLLVSLPSYR